MNRDADALAIGDNADHRDDPAKTARRRPHSSASIGEGILCAVTRGRDFARALAIALNPSRETDAMVEVTLQARTPKIAELVEACADGALPFSGENSLCSMVAAMGYKTTSLFEMVRAVEQDRLYRASYRQ